MLWLVVFVAVVCWFRNNREIILGNVAAATTKRNILSHTVRRSGFSAWACMLRMPRGNSAGLQFTVSLLFAIMSSLAAILGCLQRLQGFLANCLVL